MSEHTPARQMRRGARARSRSYAPAAMAGVGLLILGLLIASVAVIQTGRSAGHRQAGVVSVNAAPTPGAATSTPAGTDGASTPAPSVVPGQGGSDELQSLLGERANTDTGDSADAGTSGGPSARPTGGGPPSIPGPGSGKAPSAAPDSPSASATGKDNPPGSPAPSGKPAPHTPDAPPAPRTNVVVQEAVQRGTAAPATLSDGLVQAVVNPTQAAGQSISAFFLRPQERADSYWREGQKMRLEFSFTLNAHGQTPGPNEWLNIVELWGPTGSAAQPNYNNNSSWMLGVTDGWWQVSAADSWQRERLVRFRDNQRHSVVIELVLSDSAARGRTSVWFDGHPVISNVAAPTLLPSSWDGVQAYVGLDRNLTIDGANPGRTARFSPVIMRAL